MHSTNYTDTLILPSPDTKAVGATEPPTGKGSVAELQYARLAGSDYEWTSDELLIDVICERKGIEEDGRAAAREEFHSKGQACLRTSPLAKTYGWAFHFDGEGRIALLPMGSDRVAELEADPQVTVKHAMKSSR